MAQGDNRIFAIDVECMATGYTHEDRSPCSVAIVDHNCEIIFHSYIRPTEKVVSDLYIFSGLRWRDVEQAPTLEELLPKIHALFNSTTTIVGQGPKSDIKWLKLERGVHYSNIIDLADWFKTYNPQYGSMNVFSLAHEARVLLNINLNSRVGHSASDDARASMKLYLKYNNNEKAKETARSQLLKTRPLPTPAKSYNYVYEGVCLAAYFKKMCICNRPSLADH